LPFSLLLRELPKPAKKEADLNALDWIKSPHEQIIKFFLKNIDLYLLMRIFAESDNHPMFS